MSQWVPRNVLLIDRHRYNNTSTVERHCVYWSFPINTPTRHLHSANWYQSGNIWMPLFGCAVLVQSVTECTVSDRVPTKLDQLVCKRCVLSVGEFVFSLIGSILFYNKCLFTLSSTLFPQLYNRYITPCKHHHNFTAANFLASTKRVNRSTLSLHNKKEIGAEWNTTSPSSNLRNTFGVRTFKSPFRRVF